MEDIVYLNKNEMNNFSLTGNYLFESEGNYYFNNRFNSTIFTIKENEKLSDVGLKNLEKDYENYILEFCNLCKQSNQKPSLMFFNNVSSLEKIKESLGEEYEQLSGEDNVSKLNDKPSFYFEETNNSAEDLIKKLIELRSIMFPSNKVIIVLNKPEEMNLKSLVYFVTLARSRDIYFYLLNYDLEQLNKIYYPSDVQAIFINCKNYFYSNNNGMYEFRYVTYEDEKSFKPQKLPNKKIVTKYLNPGNFGSIISVQFKDV